MHLDVFRLPCAELIQKYHNSHLAVFGKENVETERYFAARRVTPSQYKLQFVVSETKMRVNSLTTGGRLVLKKSAEPYVVIACNFHFIPPANDGANDYTIYVLEQQPTLGQHGQLVWHTEKRIKSDLFCARNTLCMIVSTCRLVLEFKEGENGYIILSTKGECDVNLGECYLEMWNREPGRYGWPLKYEVNDDVMKCDYLGTESRFYDRLHLRYYELFNEPLEERYEMCSPAHGYMMMTDEKELLVNNRGTPYLSTVALASQGTINQYGSQIAPMTVQEQQYRSTTFKETSRLRVYFKNGVPRFYASPSFLSGSMNSNEPLRIVTMTYHVDKQPYKMSGLCRKDESVPFCYFYVNPEKTYVLFIPLY